MSLPSVEWRFVGKDTLSGVTIDAIMDSIYSMATGVTYADGSTRTAGSGSAGTWNRYQTGGGVTEAVYVVPNSGDCAIIIAGSSGTVTPTMGLNETYYVNKLFCNVTKNPGVFNDWTDTSNVFTSGNDFGYCSFLGSRTSQTGGLTSFNGSVYLYESKESVAVFLIEQGLTTSVSYSNGFIAGALWDSESSDSLDSESDGRLYGLLSSGHWVNATSPINAWAAGITQAQLWSLYLFSNDNTRDSSSGSVFMIGKAQTTTLGAGLPRVGVFVPATGSIAEVNLILYPLDKESTPTDGELNTASLLLRSGKHIRIPLIYRYNNDNYSLGRLREISLCARGVTGYKQTDGSNTTGYIVSCSDNVSFPGDAFLLEY